MKRILFVSLIFLTVLTVRAEDVKSLADFQKAAEKANEVLVIPEWPKTPAEVEREINDAIAKANTALDAIGKQDLGKVAFQSTVEALDNIQNEAQTAISKTVVVQQTNKDTAMRDAVKAHAKVVLAYGEAAPLIAADLGPHVALERLGSSFEQVIARARALAAPGDVVLLAPACSSYDMFKDYEDRGAAFRRLAAGS